jgi:hypothetical protein
MQNDKEQLPRVRVDFIFIHQVIHLYVCLVLRSRILFLLMLEIRLMPWTLMSIGPLFTNELQFFASEFHIGNSLMSFTSTVCLGLATCYLFFLTRFLFTIFELLHEMVWATNLYALAGLQTRFCFVS